jgi:exodeoxyribonuclease VII large subunit
LNTVLTVSALNSYLASRFREDKNLKNILIKGEISNYKRYPSGHCYFTLKDSGSAIKCVIWRDTADSLRFLPEDGMGVIAEGSVQVYDRDGVYQLYVNDITPDGIGQLYAAYEQLRKKLASAGLFDEDRKRPLPAFPRKIAVVTGDNSAALRDILNIINRRSPLTKTEIFPATVQGSAAAASITEAIEKADNCGADIIICGRGGGSFEDLFAFSTEEVAVAFSKTKTPIISAVGHETDNALSDFTSDLRAPTPSAAAELAVPDIEAVLLSYEKRLFAVSPEKKVTDAEEKLENLQKRLSEGAENALISLENRLSRDIKSLEAVNPLSVLSRGYAVLVKTGKPVTGVSDLSVGDKIRIKMQDGEIDAVIDKEDGAV